MDSPITIAKKLWENRSTQESYDSLTIKEYKNIEDGIYAEIKSNGWITINDDSAGSGVSGSPEHIERFCKWYLGI